MAQGNVRKSAYPEVMKFPAVSDSRQSARYKTFCAEHPPVRVHLDGHRWNYRIAGSAANPAVLLLPGALGRPETSFEYIDTLKQDLHVIAPGYPATTQNLTELTDGLAALLTACGVDQSHVVGGSFGGVVAQALLARHPRRVGRVVLSDTSPPVPSRALRMRICASLIQALPEPVTKSSIGFGIGRYVAALAPQDRRFWLGHFREMLAGLSRDEIETRARVWGQFDATRWPAVPPHEMLVVGAASDCSVSPRRFLTWFPHAEIHIIDSPLGHAASIGDAPAYIAPIRAFLTREIN